jgi:hypothetical protein
MRSLTSIWLCAATLDVGVKAFVQGEPKQNSFHLTQFPKRFVSGMPAHFAWTAGSMGTITLKLIDRMKSNIRIISTIARMLIYH